MHIAPIVAIIEFFVFVGLHILFAVYWKARLPSRLKTTHYGFDGEQSKSYSAKTLMMTAIFVSLGIGLFTIAFTLAFRSAIEPVIGISGVPQIIILTVFAFLYRSNRPKNNEPLNTSNVPK